MADKDKFAGLPHVRVEDFSDRDYLRIQEDVQRAEAHEHNVETGSYERETDTRGFEAVDQEKLQKAVARVLDKADEPDERHDVFGLGVEEAVEDSAAAQTDEEDRVEDGPAKDTPEEFLADEPAENEEKTGDENVASTSKSTDSK